MKSLYKQFLFLAMIFCVVFTAFANGQYTNIGNVKLYSEYYPNPQAEFKGTIIFENGSGTSLEEWKQNKTFFNCAKEKGSLFLYDRSGLGKSPADLSMSTKKPMTATLINDKLIKLLKKNNIRPPYILVAHSYGGLYAGYFARKFPKLIKGILMVDPVPNNYEWSAAFLKQHQADIKKMNKLSSKKLYTQYSYINANKLKTTSAELYYQLLGFNQTKKQVNELPVLSDEIPVIILSSSFMENHAPIQGDWFESQKLWLNKNPSSKIIKVKSGHFIQQEHPALVCRQLETLVNLVNNEWENHMGKRVVHD